MCKLEVYDVKFGDMKSLCYENLKVCDVKSLCFESLCYENLYVETL